MLVNIEAAQAARYDVKAGIATVCSALVREAQYNLGEQGQTWLRTQGTKVPAQDRFTALLSHSQTSRLS